MKKLFQYKILIRSVGLENQRTSRSVIVVITLNKIIRDGCLMNSIGNCTLIDTEQDLVKILKTTNTCFILFYAEWCPFSQSFLPIFENCTKDSAHTCYRMLIDEHQNLCEKYAVEVYPTVIFFEKGKAVKRLDGIRGVGLNEKQFRDLMSTCRSRK